MSSTTLKEERLACTFASGWLATKFDDWAFYQKRFKDFFCGNKAVDFLAHDPAQKTLWLIELKDYRRHMRTKDDKITLWDEVALKARDTLAGLFAAKVDTTHPDHSYAVRALGAARIRVVLHLEQPRSHSKLFPRVYNPSDIQLKLKKLVKPIDAHPCVVELRNMTSVPWSAASI